MHNQATLSGRCNYHSGQGNPVITLIESAGGIDSILVQEVCGREFGLLKRVRSPKDKTNQAHHENEDFRTRIWCE